MTLLISFFLLSIIFSFLCSIWEAVILSVTTPFIKRKEKESPQLGKLLAELKKDIDKPLSAILTLNTIAHTVGAIGVGAQAGKLFGDYKIHLFFFDPYFESVIAAVMTLAILFLSEIIPKTLGANNWKALAPMTAQSLKVLMWILKPFVWMSNLLARTLKKDKERSVISRRDFAAMADVLGEYNGGSDDDKMRVIVEQYFIALWTNGVEAYNTYRRTGQPSDIQPALDLQDPGVFARSHWYPAAAADNNSNLTQKEGVTSPVFWDTNPANLVD